MEPTRFLKSLVYAAGQELVLAVVRGDHEVNEIKLARALGADEVHLAKGSEVREATGALVGYAGPVGFNGRVLIDPDAAAIADAIAGANEDDHHLLHVCLGRDYKAEVAPLRKMQQGDACPKCRKPTKVYRGIEAGHIFVLGTHYSAKMGALFLDASGEKRPLVMGCYGIGVSRLVASLVEQHHDQAGIVWPTAAAPYPVHICQLGESEDVVRVVAQLEKELTLSGFEPLVDDRDVRPGVKFKDADLIGLPYRVTVGDRGLKDGQVEWKARSEPNPKASENIDVAELAPTLVQRIRQDLGQIS